jgi:2-dehydro-3-deoxyphosphooctonate aldolase (KDO 8-P synthase)
MWAILMTVVMKTVTVGDIEIANDRPFVLVAGPCQMESRAHALETAEQLTGICAGIGIPLIYKSSFDKGNRTSLDAPRGIGMAAALDIFAELRDRFGCPVLTDVHDADQCAVVAEAVDVLQIPAFLCRQTDLLIAAARTGRAINVKKGQFLAPWDMQNVAAKLAGSGNERIILCERGASFGYNTLVSDMRSLPIMASTGYPVMFDATHSVQQPGGQGTSSGASSSLRWRARRSRSASRRSSSKRMRTRTPPPATGRTWCRCATCPRCCAG